jgi:hypothetical protein
MRSAEEYQRLLLEAAQTKNAKKLTRIVLFEDNPSVWDAAMNRLDDEHRKWVIDTLCADKQSK